MRKRGGDVGLYDGALHRVPETTNIPRFKDKIHCLHKDQDTPWGSELQQAKTETCGGLMPAQRHPGPKRDKAPATEAHEREAKGRHQLQPTQRQGATPTTSTTSSRGARTGAPQLQAPVMAQDRTPNRQPQGQRGRRRKQRRGPGAERAGWALARRRQDGAQRPRRGGAGSPWRS